MAQVGSAASQASRVQPTRETRLAGPSPALDPRRHAFRRDLADLALAGDYAAAAYVQPTPMSCSTARTMVRKVPRANGEAGSELLLGEPFLALEVGSEWAWGYCGADRYVGYVSAAAVGPAVAPTHRVSAASALLFSEPDIRSAHVAELALGARLASRGRSGLFHAVDGGFIHDRHVAPMGRAAGDWVDVARLFVGSPYLWGGRTRWGIDCSGLVQVALAAGGITAPRDSDMQFEALGRAVDTPRRGDLVFFPGHVGIMVDETDLLHANAFWMSTVVEPLATAAERSGRDGRPQIAVKRL